MRRYKIYSIQGNLKLKIPNIKTIFGILVMLLSLRVERSPVPNGTGRSGAKQSQCLSVNHRDCFGPIAIGSRNDSNFLLNDFHFYLHQSVILFYSLAS